MQVLNLALGFEGSDIYYIYNIERGFESVWYNLSGWLRKIYRGGGGG